MQDKTVGVVIPIYNVEHYLEECLESVINQTYANLEIILVNDGSTDNSLNIAKKYALMDKRITLFDKTNGGLSSARNVGIEYFSGSYVLAHKTQKLERECLAEFNIKENNPYQICSVFKSSVAFANDDKLRCFDYPKIDYIAFLDSDDYWELDCIEECVKRMDGVEVVWFDAKTFLDGVSECDWKSNLKWLNYTQEQIITRQDWLKRMYEWRLSWFYFSWQGMIDFSFLQSIRLKFIDYIIQEDDYFGILFFLQVNYIYVYPRELYHYRIRNNSIMNYDKKVKNNSIPSFFACYLKDFDGDVVLTRRYFQVSSHFITCLKLLEFLKAQESYVQKVCFAYLMPTYLSNAYALIAFARDPLGLIAKADQVKEAIVSNRVPIYGAELRLKEELTYKLGSVFLKNCKSFKKIISVPSKIYNIIKQDRLDKKILEKRIKLFPHSSLLSIEEYADYEKSQHLKNHLSYKLGLVIQKFYKWRYFGGYLVLPFCLLGIGMTFKKGEKPQNPSKLETTISHMYWELSRNRELYEQYFRDAKWEQWRIRELLEKRFLSRQNSVNIIEQAKELLAELGLRKLPLDLLSSKKSIFIDISRNYRKMINFVNIVKNAQLHVFEPNSLKFNILKECKWKSIEIYPNIPDVQQGFKQIIPPDYDGLDWNYHVMPNIQNIPNSLLVEAIDIIEFIQEKLEKEGEITLLRLELNEQGYIILAKIIQKGLYEQIKRILCYFESSFDRVFWGGKMLDQLEKNNISNIIMAG